MTVVIRTIPMISAALACFDRIQKFLVSADYEDRRLRLNDDQAGEVVFNEDLTRTKSAGPAEPHELKTEIGTPSSVPIMVISNASFGWACTEPPVLKDISLTVYKSQFTFIIGLVGSGKSTLMKAMLGETQPLEGSVHTRACGTAFVSQDPWIQNLTIRENIIGTSSYDAEWYSKVVHACGLEQDIHELPDKDATKAGSSGVSLSGGQKQRLALARAVYSRKSVVLLDDAFAGQDSATEEHIFQVLFSKVGMFRQMGTTVICITNTSKYTFWEHALCPIPRAHTYQGFFFADTEYPNCLTTC